MAIDFLVGILLCDLETFERRVDHAHIPALSPDLKKILLRAGHAEHIAERDHDRIGQAGDGDSLVDQFLRCDTHRAAGTVDHRDLLRQQLIDAVSDDRVRLSPADLHDPPGAGGDAVDIIQHLADTSGVAVFGDVFHGPAPLRSKSFTTECTEDTEKQEPSLSLSVCPVSPW
jgi:hypothetical protein